MTVAAAMDKARSEIDRHLERILDNSFARMIAAGVPFDEAEEMQRSQRSEMAAWRDTTVANLPTMLRHAFPEAP